MYFVTTAHDDLKEVVLVSRRVNEKERLQQNVGPNDRGQRTQRLPRVCLDHIEYMGGVDSTDQLRSCYHYERCKQKWTDAVFTFLLEQTIVNCSTALSVHKGEKHTLLEFRENVAPSLLT